jgi:uncharacterized NAD-dependent epimerase/dehydratase family protein
MKNFKRAALLVEGARDVFHAKTAIALLRYKKESVSYLVDATKAGQTANDIFKLGEDLPVVASIENVVDEIDSLIICLMLPEGKIPATWVEQILIALKNGIDIINPLHIDFAKLSEIANGVGGEHIESSPQITRFNNTSAVVHNIRIPPDDLELFSYKVLRTKAKRVLTVGSDCNIGKMLTTLELDKFARKQGVNSAFVATGQISTLIKGSGIAIDRVISDFMPGATERLILEEADRDLVLVEGQGSIFQPIYSGVTMGLLHGTAPNAMVMCHVPTRQHLRYSDIEIPDFKKMIRMHEEIASIICPSKVVGISLNCHDLDDKTAKEVVESYQDISGLPATDPVKFGIENVYTAMVDYLDIP